MAGSLRDMFVRFGIKYDGKGAKKASDDLDALGASSKKTLGSTGGGFIALNQGLELAQKGFHALRIAAGSVFEVLEAGSSAQETENLLNEVFKSGAQGVKDFSQTAGKEIGRSQFQLQKYAGIIGALVSPQLQGMGEAGQKAAADISKDFSTLAIDLASFFNSSEDEALNALRSGVSGETEPLKRFGINLTEEGISNALGISKKQFRSMNVAEKTMARYRAIMQLTTNAQGDAARTADGYANTVRALESAWMDLKTTLGNALLPAATQVASALKGLAFAMQTAVKHTKMFQTLGVGLLLTGLAALILKLQAVGLAGITAAVKTAAAWLVASWPILLAIAAATALFLIFEDLWVSMTGGEGIIGRMVDSITGVDGSMVVWRQTLESLGAAIFDLFNGGGAALDAFLDAWVEGFKAIGDSIMRFLSGPVNALIDSPVGQLFQKAGAKVAELVGAGVPAASTVAGTSPAARGRGGVSTSNATSVNVVVNGSSNPQETGREVSRGINRALAEQRRTTLQGA